MLYITIIYLLFLNNINSVTAKCPPEVIKNHPHGTIVCKTSDGVKEAVDVSNSVALEPFKTGAKGKGKAKCWIWLDGVCTEEKTTVSKNCGLHVNYFVKSFDGKGVEDDFTMKLNQFAKHIHDTKIVSEDEGEKKVWKIRDHFNMAFQHMNKLIMEKAKDRGGYMKFEDDNEWKEYLENDSSHWGGGTNFTVKINDNGTQVDIGMPAPPPPPPKEDLTEEEKKLLEEKNETNETNEDEMKSLPEWMKKETVELIYGWNVTAWSNVTKTHTCVCNWDLMNSESCSFGDAGVDIDVTSFEYNEIQLLFKRILKIAPLKLPPPEDGTKEGGGEDGKEGAEEGKEGEGKDDDQKEDEDENNTIRMSIYSVLVIVCVMCIYMIRM
eukprot:GHVR01004298.1.p1 GENE.GHVR01004298.1~~GHVR01004298.1.p1  ORF type:complete len:380 (-),score=95.40 GHVR01004298.1:109-1248(-)